MNENRRPLIAGNWKMYHGGRSGCLLASEIVSGLGELAQRALEIVVAPPFTALAAIAHELEGSRVELGAQNFCHEVEGAFTGEVSAAMLLEAGCRWVIVGHSERRQLFGETDGGVAAKVKAALTGGIVPIACVGETLEEREGGRTMSVVERQLAAFVQELGKQPGVGAIAYEPVWAIGTGRVAGPEQAQEVHDFVRSKLREISGELARTTRILYGGSVKPDNAARLFACPDVDGALIGGASLQASSFLAIARAAC